MSHRRRDFVSCVLVGLSGLAVGWRHRAGCAAGRGSTAAAQHRVTSPEPGSLRLGSVPALMASSAPKPDADLAGPKTTISTAVVLSKQAMGQNVRFSVKTDVPTNDLWSRSLAVDAARHAEANIPSPSTCGFPPAAPTTAARPSPCTPRSTDPARGGDNRRRGHSFEPSSSSNTPAKGGTATPHLDDSPQRSAEDRRRWHLARRRSNCGAAGQLQFVSKDATASYVLHCSGPIRIRPSTCRRRPTAPALMITASAWLLLRPDLESQASPSTSSSTTMIAIGRPRRAIVSPPAPGLAVRAPLNHHSTPSPR